MADLREQGSREFAETVRRAGDIVQLVSDHVALKQTGSRWKGLCPFHQEKTPSFHVDPQLQFFYCFGCNTGGDVFKFVMLHDKVSFPEALDLLARRWGVPNPRSERDRPGTYGRLADMNGVAEAFFRAKLLDPQVGRRGRDYFERRGIDTATIEKLRLGYAPDSWEELRTHLLARRFTPEEMVAAGLVVPRKEGAGQYDRFRDRVIFPIYDVTGRPVAFGGRALADDVQPKYLNSPETAAYVKGDHLYGLDLAKQAIRREGYAIVVEGYLDAAALVQGGIENVVATLGTSFTSAQARLLHRHTDRVVVSYDGDAAGSAATVRSLDLLLEEGMSVRVAELPQGLDPDDVLREKGATAYRQLVEEAPGYLEFLLRRETRSRDLSKVEEKVNAINALLPHIARLSSPVARSSWAGQLAGALGVEDDLILQELRAALKSGRAAVRERAGATGREIREAEARLVSLMLRSGEARDRARGFLEEADFEAIRVGNIVKGLLKVHEEGKDANYATALAEIQDDGDRELLTKIAFREEPEGSPEEVDRCIEALRRGRFKKEGREVQNAIAESSSTAVDDLLMAKLRLARQIDALS